MKRFGYYALALPVCLLVAGCGGDVKDGPRKTTAMAALSLVCTGKTGVEVRESIFRFLPVDARRGKTIKPRSVAVLKAAFEKSGYDLEGIRENGHAVPRLMPAHLPGDIRNIERSETRKAVFIAAVLPGVLQVNERILCERRYVLKLKNQRQQGKALSKRDRANLAILQSRYETGAKTTDGVNGGIDGDIDGVIESLLVRIDAVPPSLAIAQAAIESGWGTSRFARAGNALFGQRTTDLDGGLRPAGHDDDTKIRVRAFERLADSVAAYALNLNTHAAYKKFRIHRAALRRKGAELTGGLLAETLSRYSERGQAYLRDLKRIMTGNRLHAFDGARLKDTARVGVTIRNKDESDA